MGASYLARNIAALATGGRLAVVGMQCGTRAELDIGALLAKRASVQATGLRVRPDHEKAAIIAAVREHVWPLVDDRELPVSQAASAHRVMAASEHVGKILLLPT